ncbi:MAG: UDP-N-acetylmuramoyl-L-alanine--D-glutamate ligase [Leptothrix sp. (in: Bacteria)]|nr:UDP-N-acetylmuramoyl-L-alanine--D-glutamate ligase [Leptothrix sp. (in: b-proteobacteria)]
MNFLRDQSFLILGLGDSGLAMARWVHRCGAATVRVADTRSAPPQAGKLAEAVPGAELRCGALTEDLLDGMQWLLKSPGLSPLDPGVKPLLDAAEARGLQVLGELALFAHALADLKAARGYAPKVLAITGTNGKTTTTSLTALLCERAGQRVGLAGNIGPTLLDTLSAALDLEPEPGTAVDDVPNADGAEGVENAPVAALNEVAAEAVPELAVNGDAVEVTEPAESASPADDLPLDELIEGGGPPPHLIPPPPPGPVFEHLPQVWVLELSSFQLDGVHNFEPTAAAVLNVTQDHLDWHGTMAAYAAAKARIFGRQALMVINRDDAAVEAMLPQPPEPELGRSGKPLKVQSKTVRGWTPRRVQRFGLDAPRQPGDWGLSVENGMAWLVRAMEADDTPMRPRRGALREEEPLLLQRLMPADALRIRGRHNVSNALAALALATAAGLPLAPMLHGLREYRGEPHRVEYLQSVAGVEAFDDSKGTNVGATVAALLGLGPDKAPNKLVVILGGDGKGQDFAPLVPAVAEHARAVALIGRDGPAIAELLSGLDLPQQIFESLEQATRWCFEQARPGDGVLLSPACASLDMFRNYAHRAQVFADTVAQIAADRGEMA